MTNLLDEIGLCPATLLADPMQCDRATFEALLDATAAAGDRTISLWALHTAGMDVTEVEESLGRRDLRVGAVEAAFSWAHGVDDAMRAEADALIGLASAVGADVVMAVVLEPTIDAGPATEGLAELGRRAEAAGLRVAVEFLPWTGIPSLAVADDLVVAAGNPAVGILIDCWHWQRQPGGPDLERLLSLPGARIPYLQLCDAAPVPEADVYAETMARRKAPGEGAVDLHALFGALDQIGARPFVASEVFSAEIAALGPEGAARRIHDACASAADRYRRNP